MTLRLSFLIGVVWAAGFRCGEPLPPRGTLGGLVAGGGGATLVLDNSGFGGAGLVGWRVPMLP